MKSIVVTYPEFQSLPKGIKRMLVTSESLFFRDARTALNGREELLRGRAPLATDPYWRNLISQQSIAASSPILPRQLPQVI